MSASFLITLREGLEISIVLAILIGYLVKTERRHHVPAVWTGAGIAAVCCLIAGFVVHAATDKLEGKAEQAVEGTMALLAAVVLTVMILWMRKNSHTLGGHLRAKVDIATSVKAVALIAFVGVIREGFETALFLLSAETGGASGTEVVVGGLLGLAVSAVLGVLIYAGGSRINLRSFFRYTGVLLILFAAGLVGKMFHEYRELLGLESGWLIDPAWNVTSGQLSEGHTLYDFMKGLFGWSADPERVRVVAYVAYLVPVLWLFLKPQRPATQSAQSAPAVPAATANVEDVVGDLEAVGGEQR